VRTESYGLLEAYGDCAKAVDVDEATTASPDEGSEVARASEVDAGGTGGRSETITEPCKGIATTDGRVLRA